MRKLLTIALGATMVWCAGAAADRGQLDLISQGNGTSYGEFDWSSPDGSRVIFSSIAPLVPADTDSCGLEPPAGCLDVYERSGGVTTLLSPGGDDHYVFWRATSSDGSKVFFVTDNPLVPGDTDGQDDIYQRSGGVTTLVSTGPTGGNNPAYAVEWGGLSADSSRVFFNTDEALVSSDTDDCGGVGCTDVYERTAGTTTLISTGPRNANADNVNAFFVDSSDDGTKVFFHSDAALVTSDHDTAQDVYQRSGGTTTLFSTGPAGGNSDDFYAFGQQASADGNKLLFMTDESLVSADTDSQRDLYLRAGGATSLVSTGPASTSGEYAADFFPGSATADLSHIFFMSEDHLVASDVDACDPGAGLPLGCMDAYEQSAGQTTLVSTGPSDSSQRYYADVAYVSPDGSRVYMTTNAPLTSQDTDSCDLSPGFLDLGCYDVYERSGGQTSLVTFSAAGNSINADAFFEGETPDGARQFFTSTGAFVPGEDDGLDDIYERAGGVTSLVPGVGDAGDSGVWYGDVTQDGSKVFVMTQNPWLVGDSGQMNGFPSYDVYSASLTTGYARAKAATPTYLPLVIAYQGCGSPNRAHASPLSYGSCAPPAQTSSNLAVGTFDANGAPANSTGFVRLTAIPDPGGSGTPDLAMTMSLSDVRCRPNELACGSSNSNSGPDYTGQLQARISTQVTDKRNGPGATDPATGASISLDFTATCSATASTAEGSLCSGTTTLNALNPGAVQDGGRAVWELGEARVHDGGPDGSATTSPNDLFAVQGVFVP